MAINNEIVDQIRLFYDSLHINIISVNLPDGIKEGLQAECDPPGRTLPTLGLHGAGGM